MADHPNRSITSTGAAGVADTLTIAAAANELIFITNIQVQRATNVAEATGAVLTINTTNITGTPSWVVGAAVAAGTTVKDVDISFNPALKAGAPGVDVTIVCPDPGTTPQWNSKVFFYTKSTA